MITPVGASSFQAQDKRLHIGEEKRGGQGEIGQHIGDVETDAHGSAYQRDSKRDRLRGSLMALHGRKA